MSKQEKIDSFNPSGVGLQNGHFIGLPFTEEEAEVVLLPVPWDVTVSFREGTADGPENILQASAQLDLEDPFVPEAWKIGLYMRPANAYWRKRSAELRKSARAYIEALEAGREVEKDRTLQQARETINRSADNLRQWVRDQCLELLDQGKKVGLVGGDHSCPLGYLEALAEHHPEFGILQIDAHMDLREAYEGFTYSHASIFYNALSLRQVQKLVQVGIRDYCEEERQVVEKENGRVRVFFDHDLKDRLFRGETFHALCEEIVAQLPELVYLSFDIDGLQPFLCPHTGTPVPGGLSFEQALHLLSVLAESGRQLIGFDLCEVAGRPHDWDGNVGARLLYRLSNALGEPTSPPSAG